MTDKKIYFLSGLPRTGSTLLGSILSQNPEVHVTPTSPMYPLLVATNEQLNLLNLQHTFDQVATGDRVYKAMVEAFYSGIEEPVIFDKHRGWPKHVEAIKSYFNPDARIVATIRPIAEIITSYLVLADKDENNFIDKHLRDLSQQITNENRANLLWSSYMKASYENLKHGMDTHRKNILLVEYRDIVFRPEETLKKVYKFCDIEPYVHDLKSIENKCAEAKDEAWGMKNLHTIRPALDMQSADPLAYLPKAAVEYFNKFNIEAYG